jgi:peptide/nickel transport system permease protein
VSQRDYIDAARVLGSNNLRLMTRHVLPNVLSIDLVVAGFDVAATILAESGLSALGLGVQPPTASWGNMLAKSFQYALKSAVVGRSAWRDDLRDRLQRLSERRRLA